VRRRKTLARRHPSVGELSASESSMIISLNLSDTNHSQGAPATPPRRESGMAKDEQHRSMRKIRC